MHDRHPAELTALQANRGGQVALCHLPLHMCQATVQGLGPFALELFNRHRLPCGTRKPQHASISSSSCISQLHA